jgi:hypothetical protein
VPRPLWAPACSRLAVGSRLKARELARSGQANIVRMCPLVGRQFGTLKSRTTRHHFQMSHHALSAVARLAPASLRRRDAVARRATRKPVAPSASIAENELIDIELTRPLGIVLGRGLHSFTSQLNLNDV